MNVLYIDCTMRSGSRTKILAEAFLKGLGELRPHARTETVAIGGGAFAPLTPHALALREELQKDGFDDPIFSAAKQYAAADLVVIAAPFWDLSFPAALKAWIEHIMVCGITFRYGEDGAPMGLCRAKRLVYVTTRGGVLANTPFEQATPYIRGIAAMTGIPAVDVLDAEGFDVVGCDEAAIIAEGCAKAKALAAKVAGL